MLENLLSRSSFIFHFAWFKSIVPFLFWIDYTSKNIVREVTEIGNKAEKSALKQYEFILNKLSGKIKPYSNSEDLKIDGPIETDWDWSLTNIALMPLLIIALPFALPSERKRYVKIFYSEADNFCSKLISEINKRTQDLELSLQGIKKELMTSLVH